MKKLRKATEADLPTIQEIARRTIDACHRSFLGDEAVDWFITSGESDKVFEQYLDNCDVLTDDDTIVAFTIYFSDLIHMMMVDVDLHRQGIGSELLALNEQKLFEKHDKLRLETFEGNEQAVNFYLKNGWTVVAKEKDEGFGFVRIFFEKTV